MSLDQLLTPGGLNFWYTLNGAPWLGGKILRITCAGISKLQPSLKQKRAPVTIKHLNALAESLDLTDSFDAAVFAVATVAFWDCHR